VLINIDFGSLILFLIIGLAAGFIANSLMRRRNSSIVSNLVLGLAGAFVGGFVLPAIGLRAWGLIGNVIAAIIGSMIILFITRLLSSASPRH